MSAATPDIPPLTAAESAAPPHRGPASPLPGARASLALLLAINMFNYIDRQVLAAVVPLIATDFFQVYDPTDDRTDAKMGSLALAFMLSYMLTAPLFGWLADRWRRWVIVGVGVSLWSLASGASGMAGTFGALLLTRVFVGIGEAAYGPTAPTIISDLYPVSRRGAVLSWFYVAIPVGSALGYILGGSIGAHWGWRAAFYAVVAPGLLLGLLCFLRKDPPRGQADAGASAPRKHRLADYLVLLRTPSYVLNLSATTAMTFALGALAFWLPKYAVQRYAAEPGRAAETLSHVNTVFGAITVVAGLSATLTGGYVADRLRRRWGGADFLVSGAGMLLGFPIFLLMLWTPFPAAWALIFLAEFCLFFNTGPANAALANVTHPAIRSSAFALGIFVIHLFGDATSPLIVGYINDLTKTPAVPRGNMNVGFGLVSLMFLLSGALWLWASRYLERDTERAPRSLS
jgi:MFS transporter, Spinster family, sphingosine-1-phosphate transporter